MLMSYGTNNIQAKPEPVSSSGKKKKVICFDEEEDVRFYDKENERWINLAQLHAKYRRIAQDFNYDRQCIEDIQNAKSENECTRALREARFRYWKKAGEY